ncbi:fibronectin type III domain-containing protein [Nocardioides marmorisolisilvae]|uniref:Fibronectin type-III domain-containing protein n=1 Tax=Nocardioides marmorisolisilvae TaxID=1542737 RepID=A0A3N0DVY5_9ACTN|nr:GDSL-type esterase/lipase family protein [Nocardioides marmorisolisilvae]RNL79656.1 hypothetical protein EFL95_11855 [Nocardioides marmorisolisilvae]
MGYGRSLVSRALGLVLGVTVSAALSAGLGATAASAVNDPTQYDPACPPAAAPDPASDPVKILLTGDSITNGTSGDYTWRYFFDHRLRAAGVNFDFVGPWSDLIDYTTFEWGHHEYADCDFDQDHDARGGAQLAEQLEPSTLSPDGHSRIRWATETYDPAVVVEFFGYNDLTKPRDRSDLTSAPYTVDELIANAKKYIDEVRAAKPDATIVMANLAYAEVPNGSAQNKLLVSEAPDYNSKLAAKVPTWSTAQSKVVLADVANPSYWRGYADTYDGAHPNAQGEVDLAAGMADAFAQLGIGQAATLPLPVMPLGPRTVPQLTGQGRLRSVALFWKPVPGETRMLVYCRDPAVSSTWNRLPDVDRTVDSSGVVHGNSVVLTECAPGGPTLSQGHGYEFAVRAAKVRAVANDILSNTVAVTVPIQLARVQGLSGSAGAHRVTLTWNAVSDAEQYIVYWRKHGSTAAYSTKSVTGTSGSVSNLVAGRAYDFRVRATGAAPAGPYADPVTVTPRGYITTVPARPSLVRESAHRVRISWHSVHGATRYQVQIRNGYGAWRTLAWTSRTSYLSPSLTAGKSYAFRIRPYDQDAPGGVSGSSRITA